MGDVKPEKSKVEQKKKDTKISSADDPVKSGGVELSEEDLKQVSGGATRSRTWI